MRVTLQATYEVEPDKYFWLREAPDGSEVDDLRRRVASVFAGLPPAAFMMLDPAVGGEREGAAAVLAAVQALPEELAGIPVRQALTELASALGASPTPPSAHRETVQAALAGIDVRAIEDAMTWVADALGFAFAESEEVRIEAYVVASGVPLGGLTGFRIDDSPICFVSLRGQEGSTFVEAMIHEATHVLDMKCQATTSLVAQLRDTPGSTHQLWHVPYFIAAAEATRRFVDPEHVDFGDTHGYYDKVPAEMNTLERQGVVAAILAR